MSKRAYSFVLKKSLIVIPIIFFLFPYYIFPQEGIYKKLNEYIKVIEKVRKEKFFSIPKAKPITRKELLANAVENIKRDFYFNGVIPIYQKLGFIESGDLTLKKIKQTFKKVLLEQTTAFYFPADNTIYFNSHNILKPLKNYRFGEKIGLRPIESVFVHELVHALDINAFFSPQQPPLSYDTYLPKIIGEGSAMFTMFLYAAIKQNQEGVKFIKSNLKHLPLSYKNTGYKALDNLPDILKYDMTLPYSLGPRIFFLAYKKYGADAFKILFTTHFCSLPHLLSFVTNSLGTCFTPQSGYKFLIKLNIKHKILEKFSFLNIFSILYTINNNIHYSLFKHFTTFRLFEIEPKSILLILKTKNRNSAKKIYKILSEKFHSQASNFSALKRINTNIILFSSYNNQKDKTEQIWGKILKSYIK
jgi:hypothetical protein